MQIGSSKSAENMFDRRSRVEALGRTSSLQCQLNQDLRSTDHVNISTSSRTFGLQSRNLSPISSINQEEGLRLNPLIDGSYHRNNIASIASKTFGLISEDLGGVTVQNNRRFNQESKMGFNSNSFSSLIPRPFGSYKSTLSSRSGIFSQDKSRVNQNANTMKYARSNVSSVSRTCLGPDNLGGLISNDCEGYNQNLQRNTSVNSTVHSRSFGLQSRSLGLNPEMNFSIDLNEDSSLRNNNLSGCPKAFRSTSLTTRLNLEENLKSSDEVIENGGFRRPTLSRMIRGRSSTLSSRLFQNQNNKRHCRDLSNINGFSISHISQRDIGTKSESRLALNTRTNWMSNQSMSGSVFSTSLKTEFVNLLENLHHSILNIGPQVTPVAEAVSLEFDRAKQRLESISEISFAPSVKENCGASVISQSTKSMCPSTTEATTAYIDGGFLNLKSSKDLLKTLIFGRDNYRDKFNLSTHVEKEEEEEEQQRRELSTIYFSQNKKSHSPDVSDLVFKKPRPYIKKKNNLRVLKSKEVVKSPTSGRKQTANKIINLKQWYPVAVGSDLLICGIDNKGATVKTVAVKKRLSNRKVELINGFSCNLIGSPSSSEFPKQLMNFLKNGLTDRWRVLQKELLNYAVPPELAKKEVLKSPRPKSINKKEKKTPEKKTIENKLNTPVGRTIKNYFKTCEKKTIKNKSPERKTIRNKLKTPRVISTPKKKIEVAEYHTRSGRTIKPPSDFWVFKGDTEISSTLVTPNENLSKKKSKNTIRRLSGKKESENTKRKPLGSEYKKEIEGSSKSPQVLKKGKSPNLKGKSARSIKTNISIKTDETIKNSKKKLSETNSPQNNKIKENKEDRQMHSFIENVHGETKTVGLRGKRKRGINGDADSMLAKKSKLEKKNSVEVKQTVETSETVSKKKKKTRLKLSSRLSKPKRNKSSPVKKAKTAVKKKTTKNLSDSRTDTNELNEFEDDFELKLNDIEIPEIANISENLQQSSSRLKLISMETPPLKYFNTHLNLMTSPTPVRSPDWCISQRTESEVKQFQRRREEAFKKKINVEVKQTVIKDKSKNVQNRDVKRVLDWVAEKTVKSPHWSSKVLQYVIPSRKQLEERMNDEEDEDTETEFL